MATAICFAGVLMAYAINEWLINDHEPVIGLMIALCMVYDIITLRRKND